MSKLAILPGHEYDVVSPHELDNHTVRITDKIDQITREALAGVKPLRVTSGVVAATGTSLILSLNECPSGGHVWTIMRVMVAGDFGTSTPLLFRTASVQDIAMTANLTADASSWGKVVGSCPNFNQPATFGKGQLILQAGEYLAAGLFDAGLATHRFVMNVEAIEVPAEMVGKLLV